MSDEHTTAPGIERRQHPRVSATAWKTAITHIERNRILIRGYHVDEMMARISFSEAIYLLLMGELPPPAIGKMISAILVSSVDHGATPPSTIVARNVATTGAPLRAGVAAGVLAFGAYHGGDVEACMRMLDSGLGDIARGRLAAGRRRAPDRRFPRSRPASARFRSPVCTRATPAPCA